MKSPTVVKNTILDEANGVTYQVLADRILSDGEVYSAIRRAILSRGRKIPAKGETLEITWTR
jgi:hypothetical protein